MLWAHLKVPYRGLPRASARREAAYPSRTPRNAEAPERGQRPVRGFSLALWVSELTLRRSAPPLCQ